MEAANSAIQAVDVKPALLVGSNDQALWRIYRVVPDRRIIGRIPVDSTDRLGFRCGKNRNRRAPYDRNRGAGACIPSEARAKK